MTGSATSSSISDSGSESHADRTTGARASARAGAGIVISPYHLTTREIPAMLGLLLGDPAITLLPEPPSGASREDVKQAVELAPRYLRLMDHWEWSGPLWRSGAMVAGLGGERVFADVEPIYRVISSEDRLANLRPLTRRADELAATPFAALDALAGDLLRAGPDPGINIPITAALDAFAARHRLLVVRSAAASLAQRAEQHMAGRLCSFGIPLLLRAGGGVLLRLRHDLKMELAALNAALAVLSNSAVGNSDESAMTEPTLAARAVSAAARVFTEAFAPWADTNAAGDDEQHQRIVVGYASVSCVTLPADAALRCGQAAVRAMQTQGARRAEPMSQETPTERVVALIVRELDVTRASS